MESKVKTILIIIALLTVATVLTAFALTVVNSPDVSPGRPKADEVGDYNLTVNFDFKTNNIPIKLDFIRGETVAFTKTTSGITENNKATFWFTNGEVDDGFYKVKLTPSNHTSSTGYVTLMGNQDTTVSLDGAFYAGKYTTSSPSKITVVDIAQFLTYFRAGNTTKDISGDGKINLVDLVKLITDFRSSNNNPYVEPNKELIAFGDSGRGNDRQTEVGEAIANYCLDNNCKSSFIVGDVIYDAGVTTVEDPQFNSKFENPYRNVHLPFFIGFGNHDYLGCTDCYLNYTGTGKWMMPSAYYSIDYGDLLAIMIDTENFNSEQQDWLTSELEKPQKWKVIFGHRPIITNDAVHTGEQWSGINEFQAIACDKADVYISGHAHLMEDMGNPDGCGMRQLVSGGGGTSVRNYTDAYPSLFELSDNGFVSVEISENALIFHYIDYQGNEVYTSQVEKVSY